MTNFIATGMPQCCPNVFYDDIQTAVDFLIKAFAFESTFTVPGPDGSLQFAQMRYGSAVFMLGSTQGGGAIYPVKSPRATGSVNASAYVFTEDVDSHCERARAAGAKILMEPNEMFWGDRIYCVSDPEEQFWTFATNVREFSPGEMGAPTE